MDNFKCPDCGKVIYGRMEFESHIDKHRIGYECNKCGKSFTTWNLLETHQTMRVSCARKRRQNAAKLFEYAIKQCSRCEHEQVFTGLQPIWTPDTHWWFSSEQKKIVFTVIACRLLTIKKPNKYQSILSLLPRDVLFIIISDVLNPMHMKY